MIQENVPTVTDIIQMTESSGDANYHMKTTSSEDKPIPLLDLDRLKA